MAFSVNTEAQCRRSHRLARLCDAEVGIRWWLGGFGPHFNLLATAGQSMLN